MTAALLVLLAALLARAFHVRVMVQRIPFPDDAPPGLGGFTVAFLRVPRGTAVKCITGARRERE